MNVKLTAITQPVISDAGQTRNLTAEEFIVYCARVSSPQNQLNLETAPRLLAYCIRNGHWSIFETVSMTVEIQTSRAIAAQILRHRSFSFQEFSQRYSVARDAEPIELRRAGATNRQGSLQVDDSETLRGYVDTAVLTAFAAYRGLIAAGIAPESARFVLPLATSTTLYMTGSVRSWIHYLQQRTSSHAQKEHRDVAKMIEGIFADRFPSTFAALQANPEA